MFFQALKLDQIFLLFSRLLTYGVQSTGHTSTEKTPTTLVDVLTWVWPLDLLSTVYFASKQLTNNDLNLTLFSTDLHRKGRSIDFKRSRSVFETSFYPLYRNTSVRISTKPPNVPSTARTAPCAATIKTTTWDWAALAYLSLLLRDELDYQIHQHAPKSRCTSLKLDVFTRDFCINGGIPGNLSLGSEGSCCSGTLRNDGCYSLQYEAIASKMGPKVQKMVPHRPF